jgi:hypothetical protein
MNASDAKSVIPCLVANAIVTPIPNNDSLMNVLMWNMMKTEELMSAQNVISVSLLLPIEENVFPTTDHVLTLIVQTVPVMIWHKDMKKFKLNVL